MRTTHTFVELELSSAAYDEIASKLREAGYDHAFCDEDARERFPAIDMHGLAVTRMSGDGQQVEQTGRS